MNKSGLLAKHKNIKSLDKKILFEKSNELNELRDIDLTYANYVLDEAIDNFQAFEEQGGKVSPYILQEMDYQGFTVHLG